MDAFRLLDIEDPNNGETKLRVSNAAVEITRGCWLILELVEWDEMFARHVVSLSKFKLN